ncbi:hypothetical protein GCM10009788_42620 [Nocardioides humi]|uniref:WxL Interacting Protein peptidoglycan binding domain-containing protein n=1 Tax=Nocardioides humi TaxID=449461 RepID=A0ABN2B901_9ACTN
MLSRPLALLAALLLSVLVAPAPAQAAEGEASWAIRTASNTYGDARQNFSYTLNPGATVEDALVVHNDGTEPITLAVYAADGFTTTDGQLDLLRTDQESHGVGVWVTAGRSTVKIKPGREKQVPFALAVPDNATPGDHLGGIVTSLTSEANDAGIAVDRRLAMRIRVRVSGELAPQLTVEDPHVDYDGTANPLGTGEATVEYTIHNTGNAILAARQEVRVTGPFGWAGRDAPDLPDTPELLPGERWTVSVPVDGVPPLVRLSAQVRLVPLLNDAAGSTSTLDAVEETGHGWAVPWTLLLVVVLVGGGGTGLVVRDRRLRAAVRETASASA